MTIIFTYRSVQFVTPRFYEVKIYQPTQINKETKFISKRFFFFVNSIWIPLMTEQTSNWYFSSFHVQFFSCTTRQTCFSLSAELLSSPVAAGDWWYAVELAYCGWWWYRRSSSCGGSCCMNWPCGVQVPAATNINLHLNTFLKDSEGHFCPTGPLAKAMTGKYYGVLRTFGVRTRIGFTWLGTVGFCGHYNKPSGTTEGGEFLWPTVHRIARAGSYFTNADIFLTCPMSAGNFVGENTSSRALYRFSFNLLTLSVINQINIFIQPILVTFVA